MSVTIVETPNQSKTGAIAIRPYVNHNKENLGLERYNMALFDGIYHSETMACIEKNGVVRYLNGLNEFAPEIKLMADPELKAAKIKEIRSIVVQLEKELASNVIDPEDKDFWNKVTLLKPDNTEFWAKITIKAGNTPIHLAPEKDPYDLIRMYSIENGGFPMIAKSYEEAQSASITPKFYLDKEINTISTKTEVAKIKNKALSELQKMFDKNTNKLFYVAKVVDGNSAQYKKSTPNDVVYDNMDKFITGVGVEKSVKKASQKFLDVSNLDMETLKLRALVKDATFYKFLAVKPDGFIYDMATGALLGRTPADCVEYLKNPLNESVLKSVMEKVEQLWNR